METLKLIIRGILTIGGLLAAVGTALAKTEQTTISTAFLPHDQQIINKHIQNLTLTFIMFIVLFIAGLVPNRFAALNDFINTTIKTELTVTDSDNTTKSKVDIDKANNKKSNESSEENNAAITTETNSPDEEFIAIVIFIICLALQFIFPIGVSVIIYCRDKKNNFEEYKRNYLIICFYLFVFIFTLLLNIFFGLSITTKDLLLYNCLVSLTGAIFVRLLFSALYPQLDYQCGYVTTKIEGKDYYCFERVDNNLIVGNKKYVSDCSDFKLIEIKEGLDFKQIPLEKNKFKIKKSNLTYNNINEGNRDEYLRKVIHFCQETPSISLDKNTTLSLTYNLDTNVLDCSIDGDEYHVQLSQNKYKGKILFID